VVPARASSSSTRPELSESEGFEFGKLRTDGVEVASMLNVLFRLIYAFNPNRDSFQPKSAFRFAVGTTF
jgi:hypothetical protein